MNRRRFIQSLAAVFSLPALPALSMGATTAALPAAAVVPARAQFWAIYMAGLHGECTPRALQNMLNIPAADAKRYVTQLIADGVIKPSPLLQGSVSKLVNSNEDSLVGKVKKRLEMKAKANSKKADLKAPLSESDDAPETMSTDAEIAEDSLESGLEETDENETVITDNQPSHSDKIRT